MAEMLVGEIRTATPGDDPADALAEDRCGGYSGCRTRAGAEEADRLVMSGGVVLHPPYGSDETVREHFDVEAKLTVGGVPPFFLAGQEIKENRADPGFMKDRGYELVSPAMAAAATPVGEDHDPRGVRRHDPFGFEVHGIDRYLDDPGKGVHEPATAVFMMRVEHGVCF
jgi:hypothetical protein